MGVILGITVDWSKCRIGFIEDPERSASGLVAMVNDSYAAFCERTLGGTRSLLNSERRMRQVDAICIAVAAEVVGGYVRSSSCLEHLIDQPLAADFSRALDGAPTTVVSEAEAAILGKTSEFRVTPSDFEYKLTGALMFARQLLSAE